jgi:putative nucleotidyltransferase with HDIG domain
MNRIFTFLRDRHALLYKGFLFVAALVVIVWLSPGQSAFRYKPEELKGRAWPYETLKAPFDFAIQKSEEELTEEKTRIRESFTPYFRFDSSLADESEQHIAAQISALESHERTQILELVDRAYMKGIRATVNVTNRGSEDEVLVLHGNIAKETRLGNYLTPPEADSFVFRGLNSELQNKLRSQARLDFTANVVYDSAMTGNFLAQALENVSQTRGAVREGEVIVTKGAKVDDEIYHQLVSLESSYALIYGQRSSSWINLLGQILLTGLCLFLLFQFLRLFRREILASDSRILFILIMVMMNVLMSYIPGYWDTIAMAALPFCILPVIMRAFYDTRIALFVHLVSCLIITIKMPSDRYAFLFIQVITGIAAIFSIVNMRNRSQLFFSVVMILAVYLVLHFGMVIISEGDIMSFRSEDFINYTVSAVLVLLAYPLIFLFEKIFGFVSDVTLMELADSNHPLLRELAERAPGTFQHSMQVANLAEDAIRRIGGNHLLMRAGALYHDIGKADMPMYFVENQTSGMNPHDELSFEESASIIISHVIRGVEKAKAQKLPDIIIDFIRTHHGTTNTAYFLTLYKKSKPEDVVDEELFRYPGPIPYSRETAVLMMADAVEASSRSLPSYDAESIDNLVERIIDHQADQHQFDNADITLKDITAIKKIFKKKLRSIYHVRVEYPK